MKVFITGGTGFIGRHLVRRMSKTGHTMYCLARKTSDIKELKDLGARIIIGDVNDRASLNAGMRGCDWVFHLANIYSWWEADKTVYRKVNVGGTRNVMECALEAGVSKVVHVSTVGVWGKPGETPVQENTPVAPIRKSEYTQTKYEGDQIAWRLYKEKGLPLVVIYPCAVAGLGDTKLTGETIKRFIRRRLPTRVFDNVVLTYVHVDDVAEAILKAAEKEGNLGQKYIIGNSRLSFEDVYDMISNVSGVEPPALRMPDSLVMFNARILTWIADRIKRPPLWGMSADAMRVLKDGFIADGSKAERELGIVYTPVRKAVEEEVAWYRQTLADAEKEAQPHPYWVGEERRTLARRLVDLPCVVEGSSYGKPVHENATVMNLSRQGMYVRAQKPLDEGTETNAQIKARRFGRTFGIMGKVLRSTTQGAAIRFAEPVPVEIESIIKTR